MLWPLLETSKNGCSLFTSLFSLLFSSVKSLTRSSESESSLFLWAKGRWAGFDPSHSTLKSQDWSCSVDGENIIQQLDRLLPAGKCCCPGPQAQTFTIITQKHFLALSESWVSSHAASHDTNTCTSSCRNVGGTQKKKTSGELRQLHAEVMSNGAAEAQLHNSNLRLQDFIQVA